MPDYPGSNNLHTGGTKNDKNYMFECSEAFVRVAWGPQTPFIYIGSLVHAPAELTFPMFVISVVMTAPGPTVGVKIRPFEAEI